MKNFNLTVPPVYRGPPEHFVNQELAPEHKLLLPPHRDHGGAGEPQPALLYPRHPNPPMGPGGDHSHAHRKRTPSPLPMVIPNEPMEFELWQRKMQARYQKDPGHGVDRGPNRHFLGHVDRMRERQNDRGMIPCSWLLVSTALVRYLKSCNTEPIDGHDDDVVAMMRMMEDEQRRRGQSPHVRGRPMRDDRKRRVSESFCLYY